MPVDGVARQRRLAGAVERVPERELHARSVDAARVRPCVAGLHLVGVHVRVAVPRQLVEERLGAATRAIRVAERLDQAHGRDRGVARRAGIVVAAGRQTDADDVERRVERLQLVVAAREHDLHRCGRRRLRAVPDRLPELRLVRLVPDDHLAHVRVALHHLDRVVAERIRQRRASSARGSPSAGRSRRRPGCCAPWRQGSCGRGTPGPDRSSCERVPEDGDAVRRRVDRVHLREEAARRRHSRTSSRPPRSRFADRPRPLP